jgi:hypothetical protein
VFYEKILDMHLALVRFKHRRNKVVRHWQDFGRHTERSAQKQRRVSQRRSLSQDVGAENVSRPVKLAYNECLFVSAADQRFVGQESVILYAPPPVG